MSKVRIIPRLDIKGPNVVKGVNCEGLRVVGSPRDMAHKYFLQGADEIVYMDIVASLYERNIDFDLLSSVTEGIYIPITVGGGIRTIGDINNVLRAGADKVAINTYAISNPSFLRKAVENFGAQCIVLSVEAKKTGFGMWEAYTDGGREKTGIDAVSWIKKGLGCGVGEILITSIDQEGTRKGYDLDLLKTVSSFSSVPVVSHGGAGSLLSIFDAINDGSADGVSASSIFHYKDFSIGQVKNFLSKKQIPIRQ